MTDRHVGHVSPPPSSAMRLLMVVYGSGALQCQEEFYELVETSVVVVRPGVSLELRHAHALQLVECTFDPADALRRLGASLDERALTLLLSGAPVQRFEIASERFRSLVSLLSASTGGGEMGNLGRLLIVFESIVEAGTPLLPKIHPAVLRTIEAFDANLAKDWTLPDMASNQKLDPSYLARVFKSSVELPPIAYLALMRAEAAVELLSTTDLSCNDIGSQVGWADPNYFSRRFRQRFGEPPTAYRERSESRGQNFGSSAPRRHIQRPRTPNSAASAALGASAGPSQK
jgi:AraC family L-rhamnose operon transcriptional activator RhaR